MVRNIRCVPVENRTPVEDRSLGDGGSDQTFTCPRCQSMTRHIAIDPIAQYDNTHGIYKAMHSACCVSCKLVFRWELQCTVRFSGDLPVVDEVVGRHPVRKPGIQIGQRAIEKYLAKHPEAADVEVV